MAEIDPYGPGTKIELKNLRWNGHGVKEYTSSFKVDVLGTVVLSTTIKDRLCPTAWYEPTIRFGIYNHTLRTMAEQVCGGSHNDKPFKLDVWVNSTAYSNSICYTDYRPKAVHLGIYYGDGIHRNRIDLNLSDISLRKIVDALGNLGKEPRTTNLDVWC